MNDVLGHPIKVGDTILTQGYWCMTMNTVTTVKKVGKTRVRIEIMCTWWDWGERKQVSGMKTLYRRPHQMIVINKQLDHNRKHYPENMV